ncbi:hypothetical protein [Huintestinicola butyrica]
MAKRYIEKHIRLNEKEDDILRKKAAKSNEHLRIHTPNRCERQYPPV